jgi:hypothetical protein
MSLPPDEWENEGGAVEPLEAPYCFLGKHTKCALQQFYGYDLDCTCKCHDKEPFIPSMVGP